MRRWSWRGWLVAFAVLLRSVGVTGCDSGRSTKSPNGTGGGALPAAGGAGGFRDGVGGAPLGGASGGNAVGGGPGGENFGGNAVGGGPGGRNLGGHGGAAGNGSGAGGAVAPTDCLPGFTDGGQLAGVPTAKVLVVDLNGDGKQDLLVADINTMKVFINDGSGRLTGHGSYGIGARISMDVAAGDLNGDGRLDVAVAFGVPRGQIALTPPQAAVFLNEGDGTLTMLPPIDLPAAATGIAIGDVDGDHHVDLVLSTSTAGPYILQNLQGDGHVAPAVSINAALGATTLGDANGDGKLDLLLLSAGRLQVWLNQGGLVFSLLEGALPPNLSVFSYVATDLNGDGFPDLAMLGVVPMSGLGYRTVIVALNDGRGNFASRFTVNVDEKSQTLVVGDFDRDGHPDLAVSIPNVRPPNVGIGNLATFMAGPGGTYVAGTCSTVLLAGGALAAGDLSGDGAADLAVAAERGVDLLFSAVLVTAGPAGP